MSARFSAPLFMALAVVCGTAAAATNDVNDALDAALTDCIESHIATGNYFTVDQTSGRLNVKDSSLHLIDACKDKVEPWVAQCKKETGDAEGCTAMSGTIVRGILQDGWDHRTRLKQWRER